MNVFRAKWILLVIIILLLGIIYVETSLSLFTGNPEPETQASELITENINCIKSFDKFAYLPDDASFPIAKILPPSPWQVEATIPGQENRPYDFPDVQIKLARTNNGEQEIWLRKGQHIFSESQDKFLIFQPNSHTWKEVSATIGDTNLFVRDLFLTSDGTIWGGINSLTQASLPDPLPVLSKFNEATQQFEIAVGALEIPITQKQGDLIEPPMIVLDKHDIFWLFVPHSGIYRYDPKTQTSDRQIELPDLYRPDATLASDGSLYFQSGSLYDDVEDEFLFQFIPEMEKVITITVSSKPWEYAGGMLVDQRGRLWLGAMGYMDTAGSWHLIHPGPQEYLEQWGSTAWFLPTLLFESSNGWLWYADYQDMGLKGEGTAWYDPETGEGCLFTNLASYVVEDADKQVWIAADGKLYRYPLEP